jgi:hypothetical protein
MVNLPTACKALREGPGQGSSDVAYQRSTAAGASRGDATHVANLHKYWTQCGPMAVKALPATPTVFGPAVGGDNTLCVHAAYRAKPGSEVSLYAVVKEWSMARETKRTPHNTDGVDFHAVLTVIDSSVASILSPESNEPYTDVDIRFFGSKEDLPRPRSLGDIVCVRRVKVTTYKGRPQLNVTVRNSDFLLLDGKDTPPRCYTFLKRTHNGFVYSIPVVRIQCK